MRKRRRFTPEFKARVVLDVLTGRISPAEACRTHGLGPALLASWKATSWSGPPPPSRAMGGGPTTRPASPNWSGWSAA